MPLYCFRRRDNGQAFDRRMTVAEFSALTRIEGGDVEVDGTPAYVDFHRANPQGQCSSCWPQKSNALGVHQEYIAEEKALNETHNVPTEYRQKGKSFKPVFTSKKHRTAYERIRGMSDAF